jgi:hypothetical protein
MIMMTIMMIISNVTEILTSKLQILGGCIRRLVNYKTRKLILNRYVTVMFLQYVFVGMSN